MFCRNRRLYKYILGVLLFSFFFFFIYDNFLLFLSLIVKVICFTFFCFLLSIMACMQVGFEGNPSPNGEWWLDAIERVLGRTHFERVGCRQFASLLIAVW